MRQILTLIFCFIYSFCFSQDTTFLKVHFLYGSKPSKTFKKTENKWFGGVLGGHVGIESDSNKVVNFLPNGEFHTFDKKENKHSTYAIHSIRDFYGILGGNPDEVKKAVVIIPVTTQQKQKFDSISTAYLKETPYDYALFGMRCGAAAYDILGQIDILPAYNYRKTYKKIFYPKLLRKKLFARASDKGWTILREPGSDRRIWEND
jgi:hypothetical protein